MDDDVCFPVERGWRGVPWAGRCSVGWKAALGGLGTLSREAGPKLSFCLPNATDDEGGKFV